MLFLTLLLSQSIIPINQRGESLHSVISSKPFLIQYFVLQKENISLKIRYILKRTKMINIPVLIHPKRRKVYGNKITKTLIYCSLITLSINCLKTTTQTLSVWIKKKFPSYSCIQKIQFLQIQLHSLVMMQLSTFLYVGFRSHLVLHVPWCCSCSVKFLGAMLGRLYG